MTGEEITKMIIGNKCDLPQLRQITSFEAKQYALGTSASFIETSAKSGANVDIAFDLISRELVRGGKIPRKSVYLQSADDDHSERTKKCC